MAWGFAVIDVETTGLFPDAGHRIAEIGVVLLDPAGAVQDEWCTLVNPMRDLGAQHVHGIAAADARRAPTFAEIAPELTRLLTGRVLVAHNLSFDARFIAAEYERLGFGALDVPHAGLCTMKLSNNFLYAAGRSLAACCEAAGVPLAEAHSALHDARAAAGLLRYYLQLSPDDPRWSWAKRTALSGQWPVLDGTAVPLVPRRRPDAVPDHFLARIVEVLPSIPEPPQADEYLTALDAALIDRNLSATEQDALVQAAEGCGLDQDQVTALHRDYLRALAAAAIADGVISEPEREDLALVAQLLGLRRSDLDFALAADHPALAPRERFRLTPEDSVVITGETRRPRSAWIGQAEQAGLTVQRSVTKRTRLLMAADPDSLSRKADLAREYGIPIVTEDGFADLISRLTRN
ncbi:exonuclease domain-containing protein [Saccharopolyspora gloriosae]|uniref:exonuclease domain-containing protein n=1 Tax=Saccharopolyspora gloriosae TaxID=455344 RepID=UPI001FB73B25|nr:exonuclease domain-containing protein [Saccharopolyspora gloriosae]